MRNNKSRRWQVTIVLGGNPDPFDTDDVRYEFWRTPWFNSQREALDTAADFIYTKVCVRTPWRAFMSNQAYGEVGIEAL